VQVLTDAQFGNHQRARDRAMVMLKGDHGRDALLVLNAALGTSRELRDAEALASELEKEFPSDTLVQRVWAPAARAAIELGRGNPARAIELLQPARQYEFGRMSRMFGSLTPTYLRGEAFIRAGRAAEATAEFQSILNHRGVAAVSPVHALALLGLARSLNLGGDAAKAAQRYQDFLAFWSAADPDIPLLKEAKQEYAELQTKKSAATTMRLEHPRA
ncbi:MAG: hypothetical protein ACRDIB_14330, partial [Ardenticatenaceae bacterium]